MPAAYLVGDLAYDANFQVQMKTQIMSHTFKGALSAISDDLAVYIPGYQSKRISPVLLSGIFSVLLPNTMALQTNATFDLTLYNNPSLCTLKTCPIGWATI